jgi:citrate lyase subunit beta-like protein
MTTTTTPSFLHGTTRLFNSNDGAPPIVTREERPRRSLFSCPGSEEHKINKARSLQADSVVLDLEDGVAYDKKDLAHDLVVSTLIMEGESTKPSFGSSELCVRINALDTTLNVAMKDLKAILQCENLQSIVIPKVKSSADIQLVNRLIDVMPSCRGRDIRLIAAIELARGMLNLSSVASQQ